MPKSQKDRFKVALQRRQERAVTETPTLTTCEGHVLLDLRQRLRARVIAFQMPAVPIDDPIERIGEREAGSPMQVTARLGAVEGQRFGLLQLGGFVGHPANAVAPSRGEFIGYRSHRFCVL